MGGSGRRAAAWRSDEVSEGGTPVWLTSVFVVHTVWVLQPVKDCLKAHLMLYVTDTDDFIEPGEG